MSNRPYRFKLFLKHSLIGGLTILLPIFILLLFIRWLYGTLSNFIEPVASILTSSLGLSRLEANILLVLILVTVCFLLGYFVSTRVGDWLWQHADRWMAKHIPGYRLVSNLVDQLVGDKNSTTQRGEVANLWLHGRDKPICVTGIITARHASGMLTVFVPCGPNPTTGFIYHVDATLVDTCPSIKVEQLMKMVVACGAGSQPLLKPCLPDPVHEAPGAGNQN